MPRQSRIDAPGAFHHVICRGIEQTKIFRDNVDRDSFLERAARVFKETSTLCFAWALMPNHFHLLLQTAGSPVTRVMRRLLTGHAVVFNRRHRRKGHLFQNRYKSILCQEDPYFLELIRYIHLNPLRANLVSSLDALDRYGYCGHSALMGISLNEWQETDRVLVRFGKHPVSARRKYREFVEKGIALGNRPELVGGGLLRSSGGWKGLKSALEMGIHLRGDERILGDSRFVESILNEQAEHFERRYRLRSQGYDFGVVLKRVAEIFGVKTDEILSPGKQPNRVAARSLACYWAVQELGINGTEVAKLMGVSQSAVCRSVTRGKNLALKYRYTLEDTTNA